LYKKNILALRGSFRPVTKVNMDMFEKSYDIFLRDPAVDEDKVMVIFEITLDNLSAAGEIDEQDFLDRAELLCSMGHTVMISKFQEYYRLVEYLNNYTKAHIGLTMGVNNLVAVFDEKYYRHLSGGILEAFGKLFFKELQVYLYPMINAETGQIMTSNNIKVHPRMKELYKFFKYNGKVMDIIDYDPEILHIFSRDVLKKLVTHEEGWEDMLPEGIAEIIKDKALFTRKMLETKEEG
ncbi:MAG: TonB-dependent receptor, partial [Bacteroidota bacterium]